MATDDIKRIEKTLGTLISWMAQSANSPISHQEALKLLEMLGIYRPPEAGQ